MFNSVGIGFRCPEWLIGPNKQEKKNKKNGFYEF